MKRTDDEELVVGIFHHLDLHGPSDGGREEEWAESHQWAESQQWVESQQREESQQWAESHQWAESQQGHGVVGSRHIPRSRPPRSIRPMEIPFETLL
ncbi:hypothetical protein EYF80_045636 [Liparis tanakae]|uniref:Uncharacterized protein n=1 Tax=Liparis tanakae TaxID=230148 RepID=A0A4Z2FSH4_9TELE|nr:hypothetical protein EYF80_045636 [Liparis tanakae]